jgi:hypothetical protein
VVGDSEIQVYVGLDGPEGVVIQTNLATYKSYYRLLGYEMLGYAVNLPGFEAVNHRSVGAQNGLWKGGLWQT